MSLQTRYLGIEYPINIHVGMLRHGILHILRPTSTILRVVCDRNMQVIKYILVFCLYIKLYSCKADYCEYNFATAADVIFLLEASHSSQTADFNAAKSFVKSVVGDSMVLGPDYSNGVRLALVLFGDNVTVPIDYIQDATSPYYCQMFGPWGAFESHVHQFPETQDGKKTRIEDGAFQGTL